MRPLAISMFVLLLGACSGSHAPDASVGSDVPSTDRCDHAGELDASPVAYSVALEASVPEVRVMACAVACFWTAVGAGQCAGDSTIWACREGDRLFVVVAPEDAGPPPIPRLRIELGDRVLFDVGSQLGAPWSTSDATWCGRTRGAIDLGTAVTGTCEATTPSPSGGVCDGMGQSACAEWASQESCRRGVGVCTTSECRRADGCTDVADPSTCTCGTDPACAEGQACVAATTMTAAHCQDP